MRISMGKMFQAYQTEQPTKGKKQGSINGNIQAKGKNYDHIEISSDRKQVEEKQLFEKLSQTVRKEVQQDKGSLKLEVLKDQIDSKQYVVDAKKISNQIIWKNQVGSDYVG